MTNLPKLTLVLGGAASGKSSFAENLCFQSGLRKFYVATSKVYDQETKDKVAKHKAQRGPDWTTIEEPVDVTDPLNSLTSADVVLIDCATLWLTNVILDDHNIDDQTTRFRSAIRNSDAPVIVVTNDVGNGIVPDNALSRRFRNAQGRLNQQLASDADLVVTIMAGLPLVLKGQLP